MTSSREQDVKCFYLRDEKKEEGKCIVVMGRVIFDAIASRFEKMRCEVFILHIITFLLEHFQHYLINRLAFFNFYSTPLTFLNFIIFTARRFFGGHLLRAFKIIAERFFYTVAHSKKGLPGCSSEYYEVKYIMKCGQT